MGCVRDTVRRVVLIAGRELKNEQGTQEVGEEGAGSPLSQPEPVGEIMPAARQMLLLFLGTGCFVCLLLSLGNDIYSGRRDARVKTHLCY